MSGLDTKRLFIEYGHRHSPVYSTIKMTGFKKFGDVTLPYGIIVRAPAELMKSEFVSRWGKSLIGPIGRLRILRHDCQRNHEMSAPVEP